MPRQQFERGIVYTPEDQNSRVINFVITAYQDKEYLEKIWLVAKDVIAPIEINNYETSVNYHPKAFERLREVLREQGKWREKS